MAPAAPPPPAELPIDGVLVRRPTGEGWLRSLPDAPAGAEVTVSLTDAAAAIAHGAELTARGYRPVGCAQEDAAEGAWADFLVPREVAAREKPWLRELLGGGGRLYEPALGPVRLALGPVLAAHRR